MAMAGTSLPYNVAHAVGNVVFCLLIGPAFLRALARYRRRLEVRWERSPAPIVASAVALALVLALPAVAAAATPAKRAETLPAPRAEQGRRLRRRAEARLEPALHRLGRARARFGGPQPAGREAQRRPLGRRLRGARDRLARRHRGDRADRAVRSARGMDPRSFGGRNLLAEIEKRRRGDGSISGFVSYTAFGMLALRASGASAGSATVRWLVASQNGDGGFGVARASSSDSDMTGAALQALATRRTRPRRGRPSGPWAGCARTRTATAASGSSRGATRTPSRPPTRSRGCSPLAAARRHGRLARGRISCASSGATAAWPTRRPARRRPCG